MSTPLRLVLDTHVVLELLHFFDPRVAPLRDALDTGRAIAFFDSACRAELARVLRYPTLQLEEAQALALERRHDALLRPFERGSATTAIALPRCRDPDDQKFLELARDAGADALLSRDAALLAVARRAERDHRFRVMTPDALFASWTGGAAVGMDPATR